MKGKWILWVLMCYWRRIASIFATPSVVSRSRNKELLRIAENIEYHVDRREATAQQLLAGLVVRGDLTLQELPVVEDRLLKSGRMQFAVGAELHAVRQDHDRLLEIARSVGLLDDGDIDYLVETKVSPAAGVPEAPTRPEKCPKCYASLIKLRSSDWCCPTCGQKWKDSEGTSSSKLGELLRAQIDAAFPVGHGSAKRDDPLVIEEERDYVSIEYFVAQFLIKNAGFEYEFESQRLMHMNGRVIDELSYAIRPTGTHDWTETRRFYFDITKGFKHLGS